MSIQITNVYVYIHTMYTTVGCCVAGVVVARVGQQVLQVLHAPMYCPTDTVCGHTRGWGLPFNSTQQVVITV